MKKSLTRTNRRIISYSAVFVALLIGRVMLHFSSWQGSTQLQNLMALVAATLALVVGCLATLQSFVRKNTTFLLIGAGFLGAGLLDIYHAVVIDAIGNTQIPVSQSLMWRSTNASSLFLGILLAGSWVSWQRAGKATPTEKRLYLFIGGVLLVATLISAIVPWPLELEAFLLLMRIEVVIAAAFFLLALAGYIRLGDWRHDLFVYWLIFSLALNAAGQAMFMSFARTSFDIMFDAAVLLKQISYVCVLVGTMESIYRAFIQAEKTTATQTSANQTLQYEIAERLRAEAAEHEQRQLAEALNEVGIALSSILDFDKLLNILLDQIARVLPYDTANVMLVKGDKVEISVTRGYAPDKPIMLPRQFSLNTMPSLQRMIETKQPLIVPDTAAHELWSQAEASPHVRSWAGAPIFVFGKLIAFLALNYSELDFYQPDDATRLSAFAGQAAIAFQNAQLYEELEKHVEELTTLNNISQAVTSTLDLQETLTIITENTTRLLRVDATSVVLHDEIQGNLWFAAASGQASDFVQGKRLAMGQGILGWVAKHGEPLLVPDTSQDDRHFGDFDAESGFTANSILCVPLLIKDQTIGAIEAINKETGSFDEEDLRLLTRLAIPAATAIENARLFEKAQQEIAVRVRMEAALEAERALLARRVEERTADLQAANAELARAARMKDEFLASISHELRTPLNAVLGISEALQEEVYGPLNDKQITSLQSIEESGRHLLALINDILDLSKVEAGMLELEFVPVSVESVCQASLRLIRQNAHKKRLKVHSSFDSAVATIYADERRLKQMLVNLLSNAVKFTPEEGEIGLEVVGDDEQKAVHISVWDSGIGIAKEDLQRLFRPFVQLDSRLSREFAGTGLGLSLVSRMVELHGGSVTVASEMGKGSRFTISFPWQGAETLLVPWQEAALLMADGESLMTLRQVLLIEDSPAVTSQLIRYLKELGIHTVNHTLGTGAIERAIVMQPDVIILDILLPDSSGWDILAGLKAESKTQDIPVIVSSVVDERSRALEEGAADCLVKPVTRPKLHHVLREILMQGQPVDVSTGQTGTAGTAVKRRILLAEDNEANIKVFRNYLEAKGYDLIIARNGLDAVARAKADNPDLIIMDIQMPHLSGLDAIRRIRADESVYKVPIIAVTALAMPGDREACLEAGANAYISKPVSLKGLVESIKAELTPRLVMEVDR